MNTHQNQINSVKCTINDLIQTATNYDIDELDRIYHDNLEVTMVDSMNNVNHANKDSFKALFKSKRDAGEPPMNTWAKYHHIEVVDDSAHVLLSRKNDLNGQNMDLFLSIDLVRNQGGWQVRREVIFLRPETGATE